MIRKYEYERYDDIKLIENISVPSTVHGYSLAIEYMKKWFLTNFGDDTFFKTIHLNGRHVFDNYRTLSKTDLIKIVKPAVAITPVLNADENRNGLDLYLSGRNILTRRSQNYKDAFIRDPDHNMYLGIQLRQQEISFNFRVRVKSRAMQLDVMERMRIHYRIGATQGEYISADFHIPREIILSIADNLGFKIENDKVVDIYNFLKYLNSVSVLPIMYKLRTINGREEFFVRLYNIYAHISCLEPLQFDDGEREGSLDNNYHIDMTSILQLPVPQFYYYFSKEDISKKFKVMDDSSFHGLYSINDIEPPENNEKGWKQLISTDYIEESCHIDKISFKDLLGDSNLLKVMKHTVSLLLSPSIFIDIKIYNGQKEIEIKIDWENLDIIIDKDLPDMDSKITIYVDLGYVNEQLEVIDKIYDNRIN